MQVSFPVTTSLESEESSRNSPWQSGQTKKRAASGFIEPRYRTRRVQRSMLPEGSRTTQALLPPVPRCGFAE